MTAEVLSSNLNIEGSIYRANATLDKPWNKGLFSLETMSFTIAQVFCFTYTPPHKQKVLWIIKQKLLLRVDWSSKLPGARLGISRAMETKWRDVLLKKDIVLSVYKTLELVPKCLKNLGWPKYKT